MGSGRTGSKWTNAKRVPPGPSSSGRKRGIEPSVGSARGRGGIGRGCPSAAVRVIGRTAHLVRSGGPPATGYPALLGRRRRRHLWHEDAGDRHRRQRAKNRWGNSAFLKSNDGAHDHDRQDRRDNRDAVRDDLPRVVTDDVRRAPQRTTADDEPPAHTRTEPKAPSPADHTPGGDDPTVVPAMARLPQLSHRLERLDQVRERDEPPSRCPSRSELELPVRELDRVSLRAVLPHTPHDPRNSEQDEPDDRRRDDQGVG
jgi:hypothetical protein